jgi:hypothetical protein
MPLLYKKTCQGSGGIAPLIPALLSRRRKVVSFTSRALYHRENLRYTHFIRSPFGLRCSAGYGDKLLNSTGIWNLNLPARRVVAVLTTLFGSVLSILKYTCPWPCGSLTSMPVGSLLLKHSVAVYGNIWPSIDWNLTVPLALNGAH